MGSPRTGERCMNAPEPTLASLLGLPDDNPAPQTLCGRPLPPWTQILAEAGIPESPGYRETCELMRRLRD